MRWGDSVEVEDDCGGRRSWSGRAREGGNKMMPNPIWQATEYVLGNAGGMLALLLLMVPLFGELIIHLWAASTKSSLRRRKALYD